MGRITLDIDDGANRMLLRALLTAAGHEIVQDEGHILLTDRASVAVARGKEGPVLLLSSVGDVPDAVRAMEQGVFGYLLTPLQPGEAQVMVRKALATGAPTEQGTLQMRSLAEVERDHVLQVLRACKHNQAEAARVLQIGRNTLWRKLRSYGMTGTHHGPEE